MQPLNTQYLTLFDRQQLNYQLEKVSNAFAVNEIQYRLAVEEMADLINELGLHEESRNLYHELIDSSSNTPEQIILYRKVAFAYICQHMPLEGTVMADKVLFLHQQVPRTTLHENTEYAHSLIVNTYAFYLLNNQERMGKNLKLLNSILSGIDNDNIKSKFYHQTLLHILVRCRWYMPPDESITYGNFYLKFARESGESKIVATACCCLGYLHLWKEEYHYAQEYFQKSIELLNGQSYDLLLMCETYLTLTYRMLNNTIMTEKWISVSLDTALRTRNKFYESIAYSNLSWVNCKRGNLLYAEDYARKGLSIQQPYKSPMLYMLVLPLLEALHKKKDYETAGKYSFLLMHPRMKKLPASLEEKINEANSAWIDNDQLIYLEKLDYAITEAKLTGYF